MHRENDNPYLHVYYSFHEFCITRVCVCFEVPDLLAIDIVVRLEARVAKVARIVRYSLVLHRDPLHVVHAAYHAKLRRHWS